MQPFNGFRVSVIIPVYNHAQYLAEAVSSVLNQASPLDEVIVVDDGSTDSPEESLRPFGKKVSLLRQGNLGVSAAKNLGLRHARGEFFAFLDADDLWVAGKLGKQMDALETNSSLEMVFGKVKQFLCPKLTDAVKSRLHCPDEEIPGFVAGAMLIRREAFLKVGWFDEQRRIGDFLDWYARATDLNLKALLLDQTVLERRIHTENTGMRERNRREEYLHVIKASIDRRRKLS